MSAVPPVVPVARLVDGTHYADTGCAVSPSCLRCPLPQCIHDEPRGRVRAQERREHVRALVEAGVPVREIAARLGISARSAFRLRRGALGDG